MDPRQPRVLVVEDSPAMRSFVTATLEADGGFAVVTAGSGFEALKLLPRERFDLIIADISVSNINGLDLITFIRDSPAHAKVPLMIISTDSSEGDRDRGLKLGANTYVVKSFLPEQLLELARRIVSQTPSA